LTPRKQISTLLPYPLIGRGKGRLPRPDSSKKLFAPARARTLALLPRAGRRIHRALNVLFGALLATQNDQSQK
jgi:hypothetical protein